MWMPLEMDNIVDISVQNIDNFVLIKKILSIIFYFDTIDIQYTNNFYNNTVLDSNIIPILLFIDIYLASY